MGWREGMVVRILNGKTNITLWKWTGYRMGFQGKKLQDLDQLMISQGLINTTVHQYLYSTCWKINKFTAGESQHVWCNAQGDVLRTWESLSVLFPSSGNCLLFEWNPQCGQYLITCLKLNLKMESIHKSQSMLQVFLVVFFFFPLDSVLQYFLVIFPLIRTVCY